MVWGAALALPCSLRGLQSCSRLSLIKPPEALTASSYPATGARGTRCVSATAHSCAPASGAAITLGHGPRSAVFMDVSWMSGAGGAARAGTANFTPTCVMTCTERNVHWAPTWRPVSDPLWPPLSLLGKRCACCPFPRWPGWVSGVVVE